MNDSAAHGGLFTALKDIAATLLVSGRTRLELLGNEIEEEKLRAIQLLLVAQSMAFCLVVGIVLALGLLTLLFWDNRFFVLGASSFVFLAIGGYLYGVFKRTAQRSDRVFAASLAELQEDLRQLKAAADHAAPDR
jgi:uncharacterized membrane protein YqjE